MKEQNYENDMYIDDSALDVECLDQPAMMMRYTAQLARAEREVSRLKEKQDVIKAGADKHIRAHPEQYGIEKITEAAIQGALVLEEQVKMVREELIEAEYEVKMLKGAVQATAQRKDMLEALIRLHGQQYFAGPSVPRDLSNEVKHKHEQQRSNEKITITRRRRK